MAIHDLLARARAEGRATLLESEAKALLAARGIPVPDGRQAASAEAAVRAAEALGYPVVLKVASPDDLLPTAEALAGRICENAPLAVRAIKEAAWRGMTLELADHLTLARDISNRVEVSNDAKEGLRAFQEKRAPRWTGT